MIIDTKVIIDEKIVTITPNIIARLFCEMYADDQAQFFNKVADIASTWSWGDMGMQLQYITDDDGLTLAGRRVMQKIGEYSHWGLVQQAINEGLKHG